MLTLSRSKWPWSLFANVLGLINHLYLKVSVEWACYQQLAQAWDFPLTISQHFKFLDECSLNHFECLVRPNKHSINGNPFSVMQNRHLFSVLMVNTHWVRIHHHIIINSQSGTCKVRQNTLQDVAENNVHATDISVLYTLSVQTFKSNGRGDVKYC